jgi:polygalacturonase
LYGIDVVSFGADPTGTNDSTTAIQNAVNAAYNNITHAAGTPGVVFFPCGMFKINVSD